MGRRTAPLSRVADRPDPADWDREAIVTLAEAAALRWPRGQISERLLRAEIEAGRLPALRLAGRLHLVLGDVAEHLASVDPARDAGTGARVDARPEGGPRARRPSAGAMERPRRRTDGASATRRRVQACKHGAAPSQHRDHATMSAVTPANRGSPEPMGNPFAAAMHEGAPDPVGFLFARSLIEAAVRMAFVTAGRDFGHARYEPRERPGGNYALFINNDYERTLKTKDFGLAERRALLHMLADAADAIGVVDVRMALADRAMEYIQPIKDAVSQETGRQCAWALKEIRPYAAGLRFHELDETWAQATIKSLRKKYSAKSIHQIFTHFR